MSIATIDGAKVILARVKAAHVRKAQIEANLSEATGIIETATNAHRTATSAKLFLEKAVDLVYEASIGDLTKKIDQALAFVFFDREFRIVMDIDDTRGNKSVTFLIEDRTDGEAKLVDLREGTGAGVRTVVSIMIHVYYLLAKELEPILFIDEGYAFIAEEYVDGFFEFIDGLCKSQNFKLVIISHDKRFETVCDAEYRLDLGHLTRVR